jgi:hypothetical protein
MSSSDKPRDLYLAACRMLASRLEGAGFRYTASRQVAVRKTEVFSYSVSFQSSHRNIAGQHVALWIHAHVHCKALAVWRASGPPIPWKTAGAQFDFVAGGQLGNLQEQARWLDWNVAQPRSRERVVSDAYEAIERLALPYFALFSRPLDVITRLGSAEIHGFEPVDAIEFLLWQAGAEAAQTYLSRFLDARPTVYSEYNQAIAAFRRDGLPGASRGGGHDLAAISLVYGLAA